MSLNAVPFLDVIKDASGGNVKTPQKEFLDEGDIPVVDQGKGLIAGYINDKSRVCKTKPPVIIFGDHTRAFKYVDFPFAMGADGTKVLAPKDDSDAKYLYYALCAIDLPSAGYSRHYKFLKETKIPLPPLAEQKRIAGILDAADALRTKRRESLAELDSLLQSVFIDMFGDPVTNPMGWDEVSVGDEISFMTSGSRGWAKYYSDTGAKFIRIQNLKNGKLDLTDTAFVQAPESAESRRTKVEPGDVLLSVTADLGRTAVVPHNIGQAHINQHLVILRFTQLDPIFVSYQVASRGGQVQFARLNRAAVKAGLNFNDVKNVRLTKPPLELQQHFVSIVESIENQKNDHKAYLNELSSLFASLQHQAFNGEL